MARPLRIDIENGLYHVTSRGWERRAIVRDDGDRRHWLDLLARVALRRAWRIFAWALLDNHFHLYLRTPQPNLSAGMHDLNAGYAGGFNRRHERCGALFQGRFKAVFVEDESHSRELTRYVHLNPVRARLVKRPEAYAWSSCADYLGLRRAPEWLDTESILGEIGHNRKRARQTYRRFLYAGISEPPGSPLADAVGGMFLGTTAWVNAWRRRLARTPIRKSVPSQKRLAWRPKLEDVIAVVSETFNVDPEALHTCRRHGNDARSAAIYLARSLTDTPVNQIGRHFGGVSAAAVSKTIHRATDRRTHDRAWDRQLSKIMKHLISNDVINS
ncbi:MAG: transposase [Pirellulales bacterium]|nr:transposase [Pirellulales bacterium]